MIRKIISILLITITIFLFFLSLTTWTISGSFVKWGVPAYFSLYYSNDEKRVERAYRTEFEIKNIALTFVCLSIPVFIAGYLWGTEKSKKERKRGSSA